MRAMAHCHPATWESWACACLHQQLWGALHHLQVLPSTDVCTPASTWPLTRPILTPHMAAVQVHQWRQGPQKVRGGQGTLQECVGGAVGRLARTQVLHAAQEWRGLGVHRPPQLPAPWDALRQPRRPLQRQPVQVWAAVAGRAGGAAQPAHQARQVGAPLEGAGGWGCWGLLDGGSTTLRMPCSCLRRVLLLH